MDCPWPCSSVYCKAFPPIFDDLRWWPRRVGLRPTNSSFGRKSVYFFGLCMYPLLTLLLANSESLEISYLHLAISKPILAYFLTNSPTAMLEIFDEVALSAILVYFPSYKRIHSEVHVRIADLPLSLTLRDLRRANLNNLVRISGVVTRRSGVFPQLKYVKFDCRKCGAVLGPFYQDASREVRISFCANCEGKGPFTVNSEQVSLHDSISYV